ncbi:MAG: hypothetical protein JWP89_6332 [Schlesneria sp.]|nr:hypothetical protein [Schlesneria sp.]
MKLQSAVQIPLLCGSWIDKQRNENEDGEQRHSTGLLSTGATILESSTRSCCLRQAAVDTGFPLIRQCDTKVAFSLPPEQSLEDLTIEELVIVPEIVAAVAKLKTLRELKLRTKLDPGTAKALKRALPRCKMSLYDTQK